eukprot:a677567_8.p1 GENE.a677567_8~~a677567_8.p1  ORF type:complete len:341 (+),score=120.17 a677567_8:154-1023(+)
MAPFGCRRDESGAAVLVDDPSHLCYDSRWWRLFGPALVLSILYGLVLPAAVAHTLVRARRRLDPLAFVLRYGFLVGRFRDSFFASEVAVMAVKGLLVLVTTVFASPNSKVGTGLIVVAAAFALVARNMPYRSTLHNHLALVSLASIVTALVAGILDASVLRHVLAALAVVVLAIAIVCGNALDIWRIHRARQGADAQFKVSSTVEAAADDVEVLDAESVNSATAARFSRASDIRLQVFDSTDSRHGSQTPRHLSSADDRRSSLVFCSVDAVSLPAPEVALPPENASSTA